MHAASPRGNLSTAAQDTQLRAGLIALATAIAVAAGLGHIGASPGYRAVVFVPFFVAAYGVLAALYGTCGISAIAGMRITCQGTERIADRSERNVLRAKGMKVLSASLVVAVIGTVLFVTAA